jgi:UDP-N-acetylmuramate--alanine ligase
MTKNKSQIYFLGIGGIGMSSLAFFYLEKGWQVLGYDKTPSEITKKLESKGALIKFNEDKSIIDSLKSNALTVRTPAIKENFSLYTYAISRGFNWIKRAELLGILCKDYKTIAVAGTHGKTTTSCLLLHVLKSGGIESNAFLGGVSKNYNSNFLSGSSNTLVVEADEYDRSFLHLQPNSAIITGTQPDHMDIYENENDFIDTFKEFANLVNGTKVVSDKVNKEINGIRYGSSENKLNQVHYSKLNWNGSHMEFTISDNNENIKFELGIPGIHNVENATAVYIIAKQQGLNKNQIAKGLKSFEGVDRRFNILSTDPILIDDYAHHPDEIEAFLSSVKQMYPEKEITCIFQPHLYTRTRDFMEEFGKSLSIANHVVLLPLYPARELPIKGINSETLLTHVTAKNKELIQVENLNEWLQKFDHSQVLVTIGAGDIGLIPEQILKYWNQ